MRFAVPLLFVLACGTRESPPAPTPPPQHPKPSAQTPSPEFRGVYVVGDERVAFTPCAGGEEWWVSFTPEALGDLEEKKISGWGRWPVRVSGTLSPPGHHGHLGMYRRALNIDRVIEVMDGNPCASSQ